MKCFFDGQYVPRGFFSPLSLSQRDTRATTQHANAHQHIRSKHEAFCKFPSFMNPTYPHTLMSDYQPQQTPTPK